MSTEEQFTVKEVLLTKEVLKNNNDQYPLKISIYDRNTSTRAYLSTGYFFDAEDYEKYKGNEKNYKNIRTEISLKKSQLETLARSLENFNLSDFRELLKKPVIKKGLVSDLFEVKISALKKNKQIGTAISYEASLSSINKFRLETDKKKSFYFSEISVKWLKDFESYQRLNDISPATIGIYLRNLRAIVNMAIDNKILPVGNYPFSQKPNDEKYKIPSGSKVNKALSEKEIATLFQAIPPTLEQEKARDFWFFSFFSNGMNVKDILKLKKTDLKENNFSFFREKTKFATKRQQKVSVYTNDFHQQIIEKYGTTSKIKSDYVFDILNKKMSAEEEHRAVQNFIRFINQHIKTLAKSVGITSEISTYYARHSFSDLAINSNMNPMKLRDALGHTDFKTTQGYLSGIQTDADKEVVNTMFKNILK